MMLQFISRAPSNYKKGREKDGLFLIHSHSAPQTATTQGRSWRGQCLGAHCQRCYSPSFAQLSFSKNQPQGAKTSPKRPIPRVALSWATPAKLPWKAVADSLKKPQHSCFPEREAGAALWRSPGQLRSCFLEQPGVLERATSSFLEEWGGPAKLCSVPLGSGFCHTPLCHTQILFTLQINDRGGRCNHPPQPEHLGDLPPPCPHPTQVCHCHYISFFGEGFCSEHLNVSF